MSTPKLYDLTQLIGMIGDGEGLQMMLNIFLESTPKILQEINESYNRKDYKNLAQNAHKLKASLGIMNINTLYDTIREIDNHEKVVSNLARLDSIIGIININLQLVFTQLKEEPLLQN